MKSNLLVQIIWWTVYILCLSTLIAGFTILLLDFIAGTLPVFVGIILLLVLAWCIFITVVLMVMKVRKKTEY